MTGRPASTSSRRLRKVVVRRSLDRLWQRRNALPRVMDPAGVKMDRLRTEVARYGWALAHAVAFVELNAPQVADALADEIVKGIAGDGYVEALEAQGRELGVLDAADAAVHRSGS